MKKEKPVLILNDGILGELYQESGKEWDAAMAEVKAKHDKKQSRQKAKKAK